VPVVDTVVTRFLDEVFVLVIYPDVFDLVICELDGSETGVIQHDGLFDCKIGLKVTRKEKQKAVTSKKNTGLRGSPTRVGGCNPDKNEGRRSVSLGGASHSVERKSLKMLDLVGKEKASMEWGCCVRIQLHGLESGVQHRRSILRVQ
jgi:hypothetical protein